MNGHLWVNRNFRLLFSSALATNLGDGLIAVAVPWLATLLTHEPLLIGLVAAGRHLPWALFALPAGVLTDRHDHRRLILGADAARLVLSVALVTLALVSAPGTGPVLGLAALAFLLGTAEVLRDNTAQTFLPDVVEKPQLERANGALWATERLAGQLAGPPLAGFLIGLSVALPFGMQTLLLMTALGLIGAIRLPRRWRPFAKACVGSGATRFCAALRWCRGRSTLSVTGSSRSLFFMPNGFWGWMWSAMGPF
jgi:MFS-type transporter involved in bile tolerance (Atg22 family)